MPSAPTAYAITSHVAARASAPPRVRGPFGTAASLPWLRSVRAGFRRAVAVGALAALAAVLPPPSVATAQDLGTRAREIEAYLNAYPKRAVTELASLAGEADAAAPAERRLVYALYGQAMVAAGRSADALALAEGLEREADSRHDDHARATAKLLRGSVESLSGDQTKANVLAKEARALVDGTQDPYLSYWAAMMIGITARGRGSADESLTNLQVALAAAESADNTYRRSQALYQLAQLHLSMKQGQNALEASRRSYRMAEAAGSAYGMAKARMAESAAFELLQDPARELATMRDALAIARASRSEIAESLALINLADIELRRKRFDDALDHSRRSLELARSYEDPGLVATSKANMGFALFGLGRASEGKRLADEALADYERTGATAEIATLLGEYGNYLEQSGDYKGALELAHRERKLQDEITAAAYQKTVLEMRERHETEKRRREIEMLNQRNVLNSAEIENRKLRERIWWLLATVMGVLCVVITVFYRKLRVTNALLTGKNRELDFRSSRDPLTALYNRRHFQEFMRDEHVRPERRRTDDGERLVHALLLIDIDLFKQTNDRYGHAAGDTVLVAVARRLRETLRETDMIVRWGGEEFLVFVPATSVGKLDEIAARIMHAIASEPIEYRRNLIRVTASIGYAPMPLPPNELSLPWERAIGLTDMALYMAKLHGRNCAYGIRGLRRSDDEALATIERDLEKAWENGLVELHVLPGPDIDGYAAADPADVAARTSR